MGSAWSQDDLAHAYRERRAPRSFSSCSTAGGYFTSISIITYIGVTPTSSEPPVLALQQALSVDEKSGTDGPTGRLRKRPPHHGAGSVLAS